MIMFSCLLLSRPKKKDLLRSDSCIKKALDLFKAPFAWEISKSSFFSVIFLSLSIRVSDSGFKIRSLLICFKSISISSILELIRFSREKEIHSSRMPIFNKSQDSLLSNRGLFLFFWQIS